LGLTDEQKKGRPPLSGEAMSKVRGVRCTAEEDELIAEATVAVPQLVATFIREAAVAAARKVKSLVVV